MPFTQSISAVRGDAEAWCAACEYGPLATRRKRMAAACRCAGSTLGPWADPRLRKLLEVGRSYADRGGSLAKVAAALRDADEAGAEAARLSGKDVWTITEGYRVGDAAAAARSARIVTGGVRWALCLGGLFPPIPASWAWMRAVLAASDNPPACDPRWRTADVLALARSAQDGATDVLPILADALQEAGCDDARILDHCRSDQLHTPRCWVPDLILDME